MPLLETLPVGPDTAQWPVWGTTARVVVTDPADLPLARTVVRGELAVVGRAASRFRRDSELARVSRAGGRPILVSPLFATLVRVALDAARATGGDVDPTLGSGLRALGYDRDFARVTESGPGPAVGAGVRRAGWREVRLVGRELTVPGGTVLDLGATAKAWTADRCAELIAARTGSGVLVSLGGDIATAGPVPGTGWQVLVADGTDQPREQITLPAGAALATSSTISRSWSSSGRSLHHILDPRTCQPARPVWRTVSVAANSCVQANTLSTAAIVRGSTASEWLRRMGAPARLVDAAGQVHPVGGWPA